MPVTLGFIVERQLRNSKLDYGLFLKKLLIYEYFGTLFSGSKYM